MQIHLRVLITWLFRVGRRNALKPGEESMPLNNRRAAVEVAEARSGLLACFPTRWPELALIQAAKLAKFVGPHLFQFVREGYPEI